MDLNDPRRLTTLAGYLEHKNNEKDTRRRMREAGPKPYTGQIADPEKARKQIREMLESATTNWDEIREQSWEDD